MDFFQVIVIALVEGITEFLPVSSTGHMILASRLLQIPDSEFLRSFEIVIQMGAIFAAISISLNKIQLNLYTSIRLFFSFLPTVILGLIFYPLIKSALMTNTIVTLVSLLVGGIFMILFEKNYRPVRTITIADLTLWQAIVIGLCQSLSMIPGVSRSAATIIGAMFIGLSRSDAVIYSYALAIPTMISASTLDLAKVGFSFTNPEITLLLMGLAVAFGSAYLTAHYFLHLVRRHNLIPFGIYRIIIALLLIPIIL